MAYQSLRMFYQIASFAALIGRIAGAVLEAYEPRVALKKFRTQPIEPVPIDIRAGIVIPIEQFNKLHCIRWANDQDGSRPMSICRPMFQPRR
ncbi:hypothetical protein A8G00_05005 [Sphingobium sp. SA916]|nr:hypothetical protein A8G00_05005 [Sphingobium sp. SA916]